MAEKSVTNIYLGAAFMTHGAEFVKVDKSDPEHVVYTFRGPNLDWVKDQWQNGTLKGNLTIYATYLKNLKSELYNNG